MDRVEALQRMQVPGRRAGAEERSLRLEPFPAPDGALDPDLLGRFPLPIGEHADAIAARHDLVEMRLQRRYRQLHEHILANGESGLKIEGQLRHDANRTEVDD